jgi:hypothetical protein
MAMSAKQARKREREEEKRRQQQLQAANAPTKDELLLSADFRAQERDRIKEEYKGPREMGGGQRPTLSTVSDLMQRNLDLVKAQDGLRKDNGTLPYATLGRCDPIGSLARNEDGTGNLEAAAKDMLAPIQQCWDYRQALVGTPTEQRQGREQSSDSTEASVEAPPWPKQGGGHSRLNQAIEGALAKAPEFHAWAAEPTSAEDPTPRIPDAERMLPKGDIVLPPLFIVGQARMSKSQPTIALAALALRIPNVKVAISVAPNKIGPLRELNQKINNTGLVEAGAFTMGTTLNNPLNDESKIELCKKDLLTYSHEEKGDVQAAKKFVEDARENGHVVIMIHDEAQSLVKLIEKEQHDNDDEKTIVETIRPWFSLSMTRTVLVSATLFPTLQEPSIWGSTILELGSDHVCDLEAEGLLQRPIQPSDQGAQYIGITDMHRSYYDEQANPADGYAFTYANVMKQMQHNHPECVRVRIEQAKSKLAKVARDGPKPRKLKGGGVQTAEQAQASFAQRLEKAEEEVKEAEDATDNPNLPYNKVPMINPYMPDGCTKLYIDEVATALLTCHTAAYISKTPSTPAEKAQANDQENHHLCKTYLVSCTQVQQTNHRDVVGGLAGYTRFSVEEMKRQQKPGVVMLFSSASNKSITTSTNIEARKATRGGVKNSIKMFLTLPITSWDANGDEVVVWETLPFSSHPGAPEALRQAHQLCVENGCRNLVPSLRVIQVGYDMFTASATLSVSDLCFEFAPGVFERLHYVPSSMVLCHTKTRQLDVIYQMIGRAMNLFIAIKLPGFKPEVLSHLQTLEKIQCYYHIETFMVKCMRGIELVDPNTGCVINSRVPDKMMGALKKYAADQTAGMSLDVEEFLTKSRIGLRHKSISATLAVGNTANGGDLVRLSDIHRPGEEEEEDGDGDAMDVDESSDDDASPSMICDHFGWKHAIGLDENEWALDGPRWSLVEKDESRRMTLIKQLTKFERDALQHAPVYSKHDGHKVSDGESRFCSPMYLNEFPDLVNRVLPAWFSLLWKLYVHKQWHDTPDATTDQRTASAKQTAWKTFLRCWNALGYLVCTKQLTLPKDTTNHSAWEFLVKFTEELGNGVVARKQALQHMMRGLAWNTRGVNNHTNHVTSLLQLLDRVHATAEPMGPPWNLPVFNQVPEWHAATQGTACKSTINKNCVQCDFAEVDPTDPEMEHFLLKSA